MPSKFQGPDFEDFTITSANLRWYHSCRWEETHAETFARHRNSFSNSLVKTPKFFRSKTKKTPSLSAQWLLIDELDKPLAWAELQSFPNKHYKWGMLIWGEIEAGEHSADSFNKLVSFCLIVGKFDHIRILPASRRESETLLKYSETVGEERTILTLPNSPWHPSAGGLQAIHCLEVSRHEWVKSPFAKEALKTLAPVQSRITRFEKAQILAVPKRKRRSLIARLLRPKIDDSLF